MRSSEHVVPELIHEAEKLIDESFDKASRRKDVRVNSTKDVRKDGTISQFFTVPFATAVQAYPEIADSDGGYMTIRRVVETDTNSAIRRVLGVKTVENSAPQFTVLESGKALTLHGVSTSFFLGKSRKNYEKRGTHELKKKGVERLIGRLSVVSLEL